MFGMDGHAVISVLVPDDVLRQQDATHEDEEDREQNGQDDDARVDTHGLLLVHCGGLTCGLALLHLGRDVLHGESHVEAAIIVGIDHLVLHGL